MVSVCFANVAEVSWLKNKMKKETQLFKKEDKCCQGTESRQELMAAWKGCSELCAGERLDPAVSQASGDRSATGPGRAGRCFPGLRGAMRDGSVSAMSHPCASKMWNQPMLVQVWELSIPVRSHRKSCWLL